MTAIATPELPYAAPNTDPSDGNNAFTTFILKSLFHSLTGTWTHHLRIENATTIDLPTTGHGFCIFAFREPSKIKGLDDPSARDVEEMLVHENGEYRIEGGHQAAAFVAPVLWNRNFVWRMDPRGENTAPMRPQVEKRRRSSIFRRTVLRNGDEMSQGERLAWRRISMQARKGRPENGREEVPIWRRMSVPIVGRKSRPKSSEKSESFKFDNDKKDQLSEEKLFDLLPSETEHTNIPQMDIYSTKPDSRRMSFLLHTLRFDTQPETWRRHQLHGKDFVIKACGDHFTGDERYGTSYEFLMRWKLGQEDEEGAGNRCYVQQWSSVEVARGPAGRDKTTTMRCDRR